MESTLNSFITRSEYEEEHPQIVEYAESQPPQEKRKDPFKTYFCIVTEEKSGWIWRWPVPAHCYK